MFLFIVFAIWHLALKNHECRNVRRHCTDRAQTCADRKFYYPLAPPPACTFTDECLVGTPVLKKFSGKDYFGEVSSQNGNIFHVLYDDGDGLIVLQCLLSKVQYVLQVC